MTRAMHNPAPPADDLALAMNETEGVDFPMHLRLAATIPPNTKSTT
jgi:hypothetical protein